jgi:hypothetical protein
VPSSLGILINISNKNTIFASSLADTRRRSAAVMEYATAESANVKLTLAEGHANVRVSRPIVLRPTTRSQNRIKYVRDMAHVYAISVSANRGALEISVKALQGTKR